MLYTYKVKSNQILHSSILPNLKFLRGNIIAKLISKYFWLKVITMAFTALVFRYLFFKYLSINVFTDFDKSLTYAYYPLIVLLKNLLDILIPERSFTGFSIIRGFYISIRTSIFKGFFILIGTTHTMGHPTSMGEPVFKHFPVSNPTVLAMDNTGTGNKRAYVKLAAVDEYGNRLPSDTESGPSKKPRADLDIYDKELFRPTTPEARFSVYDEKSDSYSVFDPTDVKNKSSGVYDPTISLQPYAKNIAATIDKFRHRNTSNTLCALGMSSNDKSWLRSFLGHKDYKYGQKEFNVDQVISDLKKLP